MVQETEYIAPGCYDLVHGSESIYKWIEEHTNCLKR